MSGPKLVYVAGYVVITGGYDDEGVSVYGGVVNESRTRAEHDLAEAKAMGLDDADIYMLIPPDTFPNGGRS